MNPVTRWDAMGSKSVGCWKGVEEGKRKVSRRSLMRGWIVEKRASLMQNVSRPIYQSVWFSSTSLSSCILPFQSASHPSPRKWLIRFIMPHTPSALPTGMMYSGRVPSSRTDLRTTYPRSSDSRGTGIGSPLFGSVKYESFSIDESLNLWFRSQINSL
jgi:hypothetical protein